MSADWIPEIVYEMPDETGKASSIPIVHVPSGKEMPGFLFIFESRTTGEFEPDSEGNEVPVVDMELHQYANMSTLKSNLSPENFDTVRTCLGLKPLGEAVQEGKEITSKIRENLEPS